MTTRIAALDEQSPLRARLEPRAVLAFARGCRAIPLPTAYDFHHDGRSLPITTAPMHDSHPPEPQASAISQSGTCTSPP